MHPNKMTQVEPNKATQSETILFFSILILSLAAFQVLYQCIISVFGEIPAAWSSRLVEVTMLIPCIYAYKKTRLVQPGFGLKVEQGKIKHLMIQCLLLAAAIISAFVIARLVGQQFIPSVAGRPFFRPYFTVKMRAIYPLTSLLEECLSKSFLLYALEKILPDKHWPWAIVLTAAVFAMLHMTHSLYYVLGSIVVALVTGWLYHKDQNIWRCCLAHFLIGFLPRCFGLK